VTTITQDVEDFLDTPYGKEIVTNSSIQILLKQHSAAIDRVGEVFYLSEGEKQLLLAADKGEGIFFAGQNHVAIRVVASEEEHRLITSNPEEILKWKQQKEALTAKLKENQAIKPVVEQENQNPSRPAAASPFEERETEKKPTESVLVVQPAVDQPVPVIEEKVEHLAPVEETKKVLFEAVVAEPQPTATQSGGQANHVDALKDRVAKMEAEEAEKLKNEKEKLETLKLEKEEEEQKAKESAEGLGKLPSYKELFKAAGQLPPLPPLPKTDPPSPKASDGQSKNLFKVEAVPSKSFDSVQGKPVFVNLPKEEVKIPQPPQLVKSQKSESLKPKEEDKAKMDYDKLFGNGIV
jgi:hypothetical protein